MDEIDNYFFMKVYFIKNHCIDSKNSKSNYFQSTREGNENCSFEKASNSCLLCIAKR